MNHPEKPEEQPWWPDWFVTRLHLLDGPPERDRYGGIRARSICGHQLVDPTHLHEQWQKDLLRAEPPRCRTCLKHAQKTSEKST